MAKYEYFETDAQKIGENNKLCDGRNKSKCPAKSELKLKIILDKREIILDVQTVSLRNAGITMLLLFGHRTIIIVQR